MKNVKNCDSHTASKMEWKIPGAFVIGVKRRVCNLYLLQFRIRCFHFLTTGMKYVIRRSEDLQLFMPTFRAWTYLYDAKAILRTSGITSPVRLNGDIG